MKSDGTRATGPLHGIKVVELAQIMAGPVCGLMLADLGADVIKVEKFPGGDDARHYLYPQLHGEPAGFMILNRNKRSIAVDLKTPSGLEVVRRLIADADVVIENFRRGALDKLGLGYEALRERNPRLVYCAVSAYGRTGPYADKPGFDLIAQGFAGLMSFLGEPDRPPVKGTSVADINAGLLGALGIVSALLARATTGRGQLVESSLMEAAVQQTYWQAALFFAMGVNAVPTGSAHFLTAPYQAFATQDGWINIGGANQSSWERIAKVIGRPELIDDPRFKTNNDRVRHRAELNALVEEPLRRRRSADWLADFEAAGVPAGPVHKVGEMLADPQVAARDMVLEVDHPRVGPMKALGTPIKFSDGLGERTRPSPLLGQHSREVLAQIGYSADDIAALAHSGAVLLGETRD